jgi:hypothetical protein
MCPVSALVLLGDVDPAQGRYISRLQAFHMRSLRRILGIRWFDHITNAEVKGRTRLEDIEPRIRRRRLPLFGHVARMQPGVPAHDALWIALEVRARGAASFWRPGGAKVGTKLLPPGQNFSYGGL